MRQFSDARYALTGLLGLFAIVPGAEAANGCAPGTFSTTLSPDGRAASVLFDDFSASAGGLTGRVKTTTTCRLTVPTAVSGGISVYQADFRGYTAAEAGQNTTVKVVQGGRLLASKAYAGPADADVVLRQRMGISGSETLDLDMQLTAAGPLDPSANDALILLDSVDVSRIGFTTADWVQASVDALADQRRDLSFDLSSTGADLLGRGERLDDGSNIALFAATPAAVGLKGRWNAGNGFTLLGGFAVTRPEIDNTDLQSVPLVAGSVRYMTEPSTWRLFGEIGASASPSVRGDFTRSYRQETGVTSATGTASGTFFAVNARFGAVYQPDAANEIALAAQAGRGWLDLSGYRETRDPQNLFGADISRGTTITDAIAANLQWSHQTEGAIDYSVHATIGRSLGDDKALHAAVDWAGPVEGAATGRNFAIFGTRVGVRLDDTWSVDINGETRLLGGGDPSWAIGGSLKARF